MLYRCFFHLSRVSMKGPSLRRWKKNPSRHVKPPAKIEKNSIQHVMLTRAGPTGLTAKKKVSKQHRFHCHRYTPVTQRLRKAKTWGTVSQREPERGQRSGATPLPVVWRKTTLCLFCRIMRAFKWIFADSSAAQTSAGSARRFLNTLKKHCVSSCVLNAHVPLAQSSQSVTFDGGHQQAQPRRYKCWPYQWP